MLYRHVMRQMVLRASRPGGALPDIEAWRATSPDAWTLRSEVLQIGPTEGEENVSRNRQDRSVKAEQTKRFKCDIFDLVGIGQDGINVP